MSCPVALGWNAIIMGHAGLLRHLALSSHVELCKYASCDDDGETAAGGRLLHLLELSDCRNVFVVVSRWYGGVQLGQMRFKLNSHCARKALMAGGFMPSEE
ncbi:hypothetical protein BC831DRAFT_514907 [Entophlyctis helioformis]|nr:hypothetical protein BC831DRAFT_514907 [Entophlyctis helioformis]